MTRIDTAIQSHRLIKITDDQGKVRVVEPYIIHKGKESLLLHCYQVSGHSNSNPTGWKNIKLTDIEYVVVLSDRFTPRQEYNPARFR